MRCGHFKLSGDVLMPECCGPCLRLRYNYGRERGIGQSAGLTDSSLHSRAETPTTNGRAGGRYWVGGR